MTLTLNLILTSPATFDAPEVALNAPGAHASLDALVMSVGK
jgi:hypothetical protein